MIYFGILYPVSTAGRLYRYIGIDWRVSCYSLKRVGPPVSMAPVCTEQWPEPAAAAAICWCLHYPYWSQQQLALQNSEETNNSVFEYYSNNIRIITIRIRIRPFFQNE